MDKIALQAELINWMGGQNYTIFTTLSFNGDTSLNAATTKLKDLHARLDRLALGPRWQKLDEQRIRSISFAQNISSNLHFHTLLHAPKSKDKIFQALPDVWEEIVAAGDADIKLIHSTPLRLYGYCSRQMHESDYILDGRT